MDELERELDPRSTISCKNDLIQRVSRKHSGTETSIWRKRDAADTH